MYKAGKIVIKIGPDSTNTVEFKIQNKRVAGLTKKEYTKKKEKERE